MITTLLNITEGDMLKLGLQSLFVLVLGLILWKVMAIFSRRKAKPKSSSYFDSKYREKWKKEQ